MKPPPKIQSHLSSEGSVEKVLYFSGEIALSLSSYESRRWLVFGQSVIKCFRDSSVCVCVCVWSVWCVS